MKRLWVSCSNRSEYGLVRPILAEIASPTAARPEIFVELVMFSNAVSTCAEDAERDFRRTNIRVTYWKDTEATRAESISRHFGRLVHEFSMDDYFACDMLLTAGDRYESFALLQSAFFQRVPIAHLFGGDISNGGHFDDHVRHAMSNLASAHFPVNKSACENLRAMHQEPSRVFLLGSPVVDELARLHDMPGQSEQCDVLISFNPMTLDMGGLVSRDVRTTMMALEALQDETGLRCLATRPNHEPGSEEINEIYDEYGDRGWFQVKDSLGSPGYLLTIRDARIVVGNSSSQVLEVPLIGQRCLLIGDRQKGRHKPGSVVHLPAASSRADIMDTLRSMLNAPAPVPCDDYGLPGVSRSIADILGRLMSLPRDILVQKNLPLPCLDGNVQA